MAKKFSECNTLKDFQDYFDEIAAINLTYLSAYDTVVLVIYDSKSYANIHIFLALYRSIRFINKLESDEIESHFQLYLRLLLE